jgi:hypothetical protein
LRLCKRAAEKSYSGFEVGVEMQDEPYEVDRAVRKRFEEAGFVVTPLFRDRF